MDACQNCLVENNLVVNTQQFTVGIAVPEEAFGTADARAGTSVTVRNNTAYLTASGSVGFKIGGEGTNYVVANNVAQTPGSCFQWQSSASAYTERDYNASYGCSDSVVGTRSLKLNPQWVSAGTNFKPASGSPLIGAGDLSQRPTIDIAGSARPSAPAIGAYEP